MRAFRVAITFLFSLMTALAQYYGGGGGSKSFTWIVCNNRPCEVQADVTNHIIVTQAGKLKKCYITSKQAPQAAPLTVDLKVNGTSVFPSTGKLSLPPGSTGPVTTATFLRPKLNELDVLTIDITQVGSLNAGRDVTVVCTF